MKTYVCITGGAGELGKSFAVECASRGWDLFLTDLSEERLKNFSKSLVNTYGVDVKHHACDLTDYGSRTELFKFISGMDARFGMLINIAGLDYEGLFADRTREQITAMLRLNMEANLDMTYSILRLRDPAQTFRVINVCSLAAFYPMPVKAMYASSKRFLYNFSMALREELRPLNATVTAVCPGGMPTTRECICAIDAQGFAGRVTAKNTGFVAINTINHSLAGHAVYIPGMLNKGLRFFGELIPQRAIARIISLRWSAAAKNNKITASQP